MNNTTQSRPKSQRLVLNKDEGERLHAGDFTDDVKQAVGAVVAVYNWFCGNSDNQDED